MYTSEHPTFFLGADVVWIEGDVPPTASSGDGSELSIGELAGEFGITPRALRFYESRGLLAPVRRDGMRFYGKAERERVVLILKAKKFGFTLLEIKEMIQAQKGEAAAQSLRLSREKCREQIDRLEQQLQEANEALVELRRIHTMLMSPADKAQR
jgi:DNA-binding transcriptional MerR regulator